MDTETLLLEVPAVLERGDPTETATIALRLAETQERIMQTLEQLKTALREHTAPEAGDTLPITGVIPTGHGMVRVTFPQPRIQITKGADVESLRAFLGDRFDTYFDTRVVHTPVAHIRDLLLVESRTASDSTAIDRLMEVLESKDQTPRVSFRF